MLPEIIAASLASSLITAAHFQPIIKRHSVCPSWEILTRAALEEKWKWLQIRPDMAIAFGDIDYLKAANTQLGQTEVNRRLKNALSVVRKSEIVGRFYSGDEFVVLAPQAKISEPVNRVIDALRKNGLSATIAITPCQGKSLLLASQKANALVEQSKSLGIRGILINQSKG